MSVLNCTDVPGCKKDSMSRIRREGKGFIPEIIDLPSLARAINSTHFLTQSEVDLFHIAITNTPVYII